MNASPASARSVEPFSPDDTLWVRSLNWLGDCVMALPALAALKRRQSAIRLVIGCRPHLAAFWSLCPYVDVVQELKPDCGADWRAAAALRRLRANRAVVLPNSFRSAWVPFLAGVPHRIGFPGRFRRFLLTRAVHPVSYSGSRHQALDYFVLFDQKPETVPPSLGGLIRFPVETAGRMRERLAEAAKTRPAFPPAGPWIAVAPGAARGGSKRWPAAHFAVAAAAAHRATGCGIVVVGTASERDAAGEIEATAPGAVLDLTGGTSLPELAALFRLCAAVLCNDSGPMHLAAAGGTRVVAVFGLTDPERTGPLGEGHVVLAPPGVAGNAVIARESDAARRALAAIVPEQAAEAVVRLVRRAGG